LGEGHGKFAPPIRESADQFDTTLAPLFISEYVAEAVNSV
jgi:hypothetical protein